MSIFHKRMGLDQFYHEMERIRRAVRQRERFGRLAAIPCLFGRHADDLAAHGPGGTTFVCVRCKRRSGS